MRHILLRARVGLVLTLALLTASTEPRAAAAPAKGTEILWDTFGIPHIFAPDHPSLFHAYGYAQMEGHAELLVRLYAQARGRAARVLRRLVPGERPLGADDRHPRKRPRQWAAQQTPEFGALIRAFADGLNAWADEEPGRSLSPAARGVLPLTPEDVYAHGLRIIHYDWLTSENSVYRKARQQPIETHGSNGWAIGPSKTRLRQRDADEQLASAVVATWTPTSRSSSPRPA